MNILFVSESDWLKSVTYDIHILAEGMSLRGHQVYAIDHHHWEKESRFRFSRRNEFQNGARIYPEARVYLRRSGYIGLPTFGKTGVALVPGIGIVSTALLKYYEICQIIRAHKIDIIVLYSVVNFGLPAVRIARMLGTPVVFRNIDILYNLWPAGRMRTRAKALERKVYPRVDAVLALTPKYAEYLKAFGADESKTRLLLFPLDTGLFKPGLDFSDIQKRWAISPEDKPVVFVGTLYEFSGLADFVREFPGVIRDVPEAKLVIVGDGPLRPELERVTGELGLQRHVIIAGYQPFSTMPQYINMATLCVNSFLVNENTRDIFSAKIVQYLACGKATVSTALPGITTLIPGESAGVIYAETAADMVREVIGLLKSPGRREQLGQAGLEYVERNHTYEKVTGQLEECLQEVVHQKRNKGSLR